MAAVPVLFIAITITANDMALDNALLVALDAHFAVAPFDAYAFAIFGIVVVAAMEFECLHVVVIGAIEATVVVAIELIEHPVGGSGRLLATDPSVFVGVDIELGAVMAHDDAVAHGLRDGRDGHCGGRNANGDCQSHFGNPLLAPRRSEPKPDHGRARLRLYVSAATFPQWGLCSGVGEQRRNGPMISRLCAGLALAMLAVAPAEAQHVRTGPRPPIPDLPPPAITATMSDAELAAGLDPWLANLAREGTFSGSLLLARDGREIFAGGYGQADRARNVAAAADTSFSIASIGKQFTHVAIAQLVQAGRLSRTATIGELLPDFPNAAAHGATIDQLINHRGGLGDIFSPEFANAPKEPFATNADYYRFIGQQPQQFPPGEREQYCNGCYIVLGEIVARVSGMPYEAYVTHNIIEPLGMTHTGFYRLDRLPANAARPYGRPRPDSEIVDVASWHGVAGSAAGGLFSNARDLLAFDNALREHRLVNAEMTAWIMRGEPEQARATRRIGFAGGAPGMNAVLMGNGQWTLVVLANQEPPAAQAVTQAVFSLLAGPARP